MINIFLIFENEMIWTSTIDFGDQDTANYITLSYNFLILIIIKLN